MKNKTYIEGDLAYIYVRHHTGSLKVVIDKADLDVAARFKGAWCAIKLRSKVYIRGAIRDCIVRSKNTTIYLHRLLLQARAGVPVRHLDGNGLNNRRSNLILVGGIQRLSQEVTSQNG